MEPEVHKTPTRYYEIDLFRFLAAVVVVLYHFTYRGYHADHASSVEYSGIGGIFKYGWLGVELFFIISGYVVLLSAQGKTLGQFFISRVTRLYPAYLVACTLTFVVVRLFGPTINSPNWSMMFETPSLMRYVFNMTMLQHFFGVHDIDGVYWTLAYEILFYFLIALIIAFKWFDHLLTVLIIWLGFAAIAPIALDGPFTFLLFPKYAPFFIAGMVFYLLQTKKAAAWKLYILLLVSYLLCLRTGRDSCAEMEHSFHDAFSFKIVGGLLTLFFAAFLLTVNNLFKLRPVKWLTTVSALTYPIYLLHHNPGYVVLQHLGGKIDKYLLLIIMLVALFVIAYLVNIFVEQRGSKLLATKLRSLIRE